MNRSVTKRRIDRRIGLLAVIACAVAVFGVGCQNKSGGGEEIAARSERVTFDSWESFLESDAHKQTQRRPVVFVGIDGATWGFMDSLLARGALPNIARIRREGAYATLRSVQSYVSPPGWTALLSGYLPEKSGIYTFGSFDRNSGAFNSVRSTDVLVPFAWEATSRAGMKTAVVNVPMTYPVYPVNGIMVSGLLTPIEVGHALSVRTSNRDDLLDLDRRARRDAAERVEDASEPIVSEVQVDLNLFIILLHDTQDDARRDYDTVSLHDYAMARDGSLSSDPDIYTFPVDEYSPWVRVRVKDGDKDREGFGRMKVSISGGSLAIHFSETVFPLDVVYTYPGTLADELTREFGFYLPTKSLSKEILPTLTKDTSKYGSFFYGYDDWDAFFMVYTQTDNVQHKSGFGVLTEEVYEEIDRFIGELLGRLPKDAVLVIGSDHGFAAYEWGIDLNRYLGELNLLEWNGRHVDYDHTLVFHNLWHLYFNDELITREELFRRGIDVPPASDPVEFLRDYLIDACRNIRAGGKSFPVEVERMPEGARGDVPDMRVTGSYSNYEVTYWNVMKPRDDVVWRMTGHDRFWHARDGIFLMWGDGVKTGYDAGVVDIQNVAPTMLYLLGLPVADDMDGVVMTNMISPELVNHRPIFVNEAYGDIPRGGPETAGKREDLEKKLKSLGYIQ